MKTSLLSHLCPGYLLVLGILCLTSCVNRIAGEDDEPLPDEVLPRQSLHVQTRGAGEALLEYPVHIYAFKADGTCAGSQAIASEADKLNLSLPKGKYRLVALAGTGGYNLPEPMTLKGIITAKSGQFATSALMMGNADITLEAINQTINITLGYAVARVLLTLTQVPTEITQTSIAISPLSATLTMSGEPATEASVLTSPCSRGSDGNWNTSDLYTFGGNGQNSICSITLANADNSKTYGYTYAEVLQVGIPYAMLGNFEGGTFAVGGSLVASGWKNQVNVAFGFGSGGNTGDDGVSDSGSGSDSDTGGGETITVTAIPTAGTLWNGHLVALVSNLNAAKTEADLLLLSRKEWKDVPGAYNTTAGNRSATALVATYSETGMTGWRMPTGPEATNLKKTYGSALIANCLDELNSLLVSTGGDALTYGGKDTNGDEVRYLCAEGTQSFAFNKPTGSNTSTTNTVRTYYLRAMRTQHVAVANNTNL